MIYLASIPRCGSTYLFRSIAGLPQGDSIPPGAEEEHEIVKLHVPPEKDVRVAHIPGDRAIFLFGDVATAVVSTMENRHEANHWANCGVEDYDPDADLLEDDLLGYADLWSAWRDAPFPVLFVRYDRLRSETTRDVIEEWLGASVRWLPWRERSTVATPPQRERVERAYGRLVADVENSPGVFFGGRVRVTSLKALSYPIRLDT